MPPALLGAGEAGFESVPMGRGGPMVPKRMEASCFALPPVGAESSSSSSLSDDSTTDQSSSSEEGLRDRRLEAGPGSGRVVFAAPSEGVVMAWKGLVSRLLASGEATEGVPAADGGWFMLFQNGFFDSACGDWTAGGLPIAVPGSGGADGGRGGAGGGAASLDGLAAFSDKTVLAVGVLSSGVIRDGSSSSLLSSLSMFSS